MAGFCSQCGRPLADGEVCTCTQQAAQNQQFNVAGQQNYQQYSQDVQQNAYQQQASAGQNTYQQVDPNVQQHNANAQQQYNANAQQQYNAGAQQQYNAGAQQYNPGQQQFDANGQPINGPIMYTAPAQPSAFAIKCRQFGMDTLNTLKNPIRAIGEIAQRNDFFYGLIMICADVLIVFFVALLFGVKINSMLGGWISVPSPVIAFISCLGVIASYAAQAGTLLGMSKAFGAGSSITFVQALTYVGGKAFYGAMVAIVAGLFCMINISFGLVILAVGSMLAFLIGAMSYYQALAIDGSKKVYVLLVVFIANLLVVYLVSRLLLFSLSSVISSSGLFNLIF